MRNRWTGAAWALCAALLGAAPAGAGALHGGVRAGLAFANFRGDFADLVGTDARLGPVVGPFVTWQPSPRLGLQGEMLYVRKGARSDLVITDAGGNVIGSFEGFWNIDYLEIPLLVRVSLAPALPVEPYLVAGPAFGIALHGAFESRGGPLADQELEDLKAVDFGLAGGLGVAFDAGGWRMLLEGRYTGGLSDVYDIAGNLESINSAFALTAAITR